SRDLNYDGALTGLFDAVRRILPPGAITEANPPLDVAMGEGVRAGGSRHSRQCLGCGSRSWRIGDSVVDRPCWRVQEQVVPHGRDSRSITRPVDSRPTTRVRHTFVPIHFMAASRASLGCWRGVL